MTSMTPDTSLYRQVPAGHVQNGEITSQVFQPTKKDEKRLSVYDGSQISAAESLKHYTEVLCWSSIGVVAVSVGECDSLLLPVYADPERYKEHVLIDFSEFGRSQIERKADFLKQCAIGRGWQFGPV